jgi:hypothetical protein
MTEGSGKEFEPLLADTMTKTDDRRRVRRDGERLRKPENRVSFWGD